MFSTLLFHHFDCCHFQSVSCHALLNACFHVPGDSRRLPAVQPRLQSKVTEWTFNKDHKYCYTPQFACFFIASTMHIDSSMEIYIFWVDGNILINIFCNPQVRLRAAWKGGKKCCPHLQVKYIMYSNILKKDTTSGIVIFNIFVSRSGRRILVAQERMASLGYTSLRLYRSADIFGFWFLSCKIKSHIIINFLQGQHQRLEGKWRPSTITVRGIKIVID